MNTLQWGLCLLSPIPQLLQQRASWYYLMNDEKNRKGMLLKVGEKLDPFTTTAGYVRCWSMKTILSSSCLAMGELTGIFTPRKWAVQNVPSGTFDNSHVYQSTNSFKCFLLSHTINLSSQHLSLEKEQIRKIIIIKSSNNNNKAPFFPVTVNLSRHWHAIPTLYKFPFPPLMPILNSQHLLHPWHICLETWDAVFVLPR